MRKLLGYRLKEEFKEFYKAYSCIAFGNDCGSAIYETYDYECRDIVIDRLKQAGVMHWFEEVYEEDKFKAGDLVVTENDAYYSWGTVQKIKHIEENEIHIESGGYWLAKHTRHATEEEKKCFNSLNGKTAIIDGVEYELKIKN